MPKKGNEKAVKAVKAEVSESESSSGSGSDDDTPVKKVVKKVVLVKKVVKKVVKKESSSEDSSSSGDDSSDEGTNKSPTKKVVVKKKVVAKKVVAKKKPVESSSDSESDSDSSDDEKPAATKKVMVKKKVVKKPVQAKPVDTADIFAEVNDKTTMSKAQQKRLRKKQAEAAAAAGGPPAEETKEAVSDEPKQLSKNQMKKLKEKEKAAAKAAAKAPSAAVKALKKKMEQQKEEEERFRAEEEARIKQIEEEERIAEEERVKEEEKKAKRAEEKRLKKEELRKQGKLLSKSQRAKQAKSQAALKLMQEQGLISATASAHLDGDEEGEAEARQKRPKFDKKKKKPAGKTKGQLENERLLKEMEEKKKLQEEEREKTKIAEEAKKAAEKKMEDLEKALEALALEEATLMRGEEEEEEEEKFENEEDAFSGKEEDNWDDSDNNSEGEDVPDAWDADSDEELEKSKKKKVEKAAKTAKFVESKVDNKEAELERIKKEREQIKEQIKAAKAVFEVKKEAFVEAKAESVPEPAKRNKKKDQEAQVEQQAQVVKNSRAGRLRSPICCILGHVDTGKTKLLDKIRATNVQDKEAGGITQQIGASYFPMDTINAKTADLRSDLKKQLEIKVPGLLVIDTPGHESFTNLRSRGSGLCDIAILVVDIMHGLEPQTLESIGLLKMRKTPFIVALNKIDRIYGWKETPNGAFVKSFKNQNADVQKQFHALAKDTVTLFAEQGLNCCLYFENKDFRKTISLVPTSAITGEGIPDLLFLLCQLTQNLLNDRLLYSGGLQCTVLEVKQVEGLGMTIDVILVNGTLKEGDVIVVCGLQGPIVTTIRALLTPPPLKEMRVKSEYVHHKVVHASMGIKIAANNLDTAIAGGNLLVCGKDDDIEDLKDEVQEDLATILSRIDRSGQGVYVQASTLGSLEALLSFLENSKIPVCGLNIGPVHKKDVMKSAVMLEHKPEYATILAFDVKVAADAATMAEKLGVKIFTADIIYHLFDQMTEYTAKIKKERQEAAAGKAIFPVALEIMPNCIFRARDPIVIGVKVTAGHLRIGTPICVPDRKNETNEIVILGKVTSIQANHVEVKDAKKGAEVAIRLELSAGQQKVMAGRHFDESSKLYSKLTRESINMLKENFKEDVDDDGWRCAIKIKKLLQID